MLELIWTNPRTVLEIIVVVIVLVHMGHTGKSIHILQHEFSSSRTSLGELQREFSALRDTLGIVFEKVNELNRAELLQLLSMTAKDAEQSIIHYSFTFNLPSDEPEMEPLLNAITTTSVPKEKIRFLGPDYTENLNRLYSRKRTGAQVRVSHTIRISDLRFQVADGKRVVQTIGSASERGRLGFLVESIFLGRILTKWFDDEWEKSREYDDYVRQMIVTTMTAPEIASLKGDQLIQYISSRLGLEESEVRRLMPETPPAPSQGNILRLH